MGNHKVLISLEDTEIQKVIDQEISALVSTHLRNEAERLILEKAKDVIATKTRPEVIEQIVKRRISDILGDNYNGGRMSSVIKELVEKTVKDISVNTFADSVWPTFESRVRIYLETYLYKSIQRAIQEVIEKESKEMITKKVAEIVASSFKH